MSQARELSHAEIDQTAKQISDDFTQQFKSPRGNLQPLIDELQEERSKLKPAQYRELVNDINYDLKKTLPGVTIVGFEMHNGREVLDVYRNANPATPANYANQFLTGDQMSEMRRMAPIPAPLPDFGDKKNLHTTQPSNKEAEKSVAKRNN